MKSWIIFGKERVEGGHGVSELLLNGARIKERINEDKKRLADIDASIIEHVSRYMDSRHRTSCKVRCEDHECRVSIRDDVKLIPERIDQVVDYLGSRYLDLVEAKKVQVYTLSKKLREMVLGGDAEEIKECFKINTTAAVKYNN